MIALPLATFRIAPTLVIIAAAAIVACGAQPVAVTYHRRMHSSVKQFLLATALPLCLRVPSLNAQEPPPLRETVYSCTEVRVVHHEPIWHAASFGEFLTARTGCTPYSNSANDFATCAEGGLLGRMGCNRIAATRDLGGLTPAEPMAVCIRDGDDPHVLLRGGGLWSVSGWYIVRKGGRFQAIRTFEELRKEFAPIETAEEALSLVLAAYAWEAEARFGVEAAPDLRYYVPLLEDTYVSATPAGFTVHNVYTRGGCGPRLTGTVDFDVSRAGQLFAGPSLLVADDKGTVCE